MSVRKTSPTASSPNCRNAKCSLSVRACMEPPISIPARTAWRNLCIAHGFSEVVSVVSIPLPLYLQVAREVVGALLLSVRRSSSVLRSWTDAIHAPSTNTAAWIQDVLHSSVCAEAMARAISVGQEPRVALSAMRPSFILVAFLTDAPCLFRLSVLLGISFLWRSSAALESGSLSLVVLARHGSQLCAVFLNRLRSGFQFP